MIRVFSLFLLFGLLLPLPSQAGQNAQLNGVATSLSLYYPKIQPKQVSPTPIAGVFEIITQKDEILYFAPRTGHILVGEIWSSDGHNLTRETQNRLMEGKISQLPLDKALKIGSGPNQVIEVSDPDCPFCREGSAFFLGRNDVTRYVFLYPLSKIHPESEAKARYILSAENPAEAYEEVFSGEFDDKPLPEFKDNGLLDVQRQIAKGLGIHSTPRYWINGHYISGTNLKEFEKLLGQK